MGNIKFSALPAITNAGLATDDLLILVDSSVPQAVNLRMDELDKRYTSTVSPTFTGTPTLPTGTIATTQTSGNNTTAIATTAFTTAAVGVLSSSTTTALALKAAVDSQTFTGTPTLPTGTIATTQSSGNNTTAIATTAYTTAAVSTLSGTTTTALALKAAIDSQTFTGTPTLPTGTIATTQTSGNNTTAIATTAYADAAYEAGLFKWSDTTAVASIANDTEQTVKTKTIPANTLTANGDYIEMEALFDMVNNAALGRLYYGGTLIACFIMGLQIRLQCKIIRTGASAQLAYVQVSDTSYTGDAVTATTLALANSSNQDLVIKWTGDSGLDCTSPAPTAMDTSSNILFFTGRKVKA